MKLSQRLFKIAKSLLCLEDSQTEKINVLCDPFHYYYPVYITIKQSQNKYTLIKTISFEQYLKFNQLDKHFAEKIISKDLYYNEFFLSHYCSYRKEVDIQELKKEIVYGQFKLDMQSFSEIYKYPVSYLQYNDFEIYIVDSQFDLQQIKFFLNKIYSIIPYSLLSKLKCKIQFRKQLQNNRIAQYENNSNIIQIKELNIHAFIHQLGHKYSYMLKSEYRFNLVNEYKMQINFPSELSKQNKEQYFAELFAFYFQNKLNIKQKEFIEETVFNKRIRKAFVKIFRQNNDQYNINESYRFYLKKFNNL